MRSPAPRALVALLAAALVTCGRGDVDAGDSSSPASLAPQQTPLQGATDSATLATPRGPSPVRADSVPGSTDVLAEPLQWTADVVIARLRDAGLSVTPAGGVRQPGVGAAGLRVNVNQGAGEVQAFIFGDPGAVGNATAGLDAARYSAGARRASLVVDNNMAALVLTGDEKLRERIRFALVARRGEGR